MLTVRITNQPIILNSFKQHKKLDVEFAHYKEDWHLDNNRLKMNNSSYNTREILAEGNRAVKIAVYSSLITSGLLCNSFIIVLFTKTPQLRKSINYYILNMAISHLFVLIFSASVRLEENISNNRHWKVHGSFGDFLCKTVFYFSDLSPLVSTFCLVFMSLDRFLAVLFPTKRHWRSQQVRRYLIVISWIVPMLYCSKQFHSYHIINSFCGSFWGPPFEIHVIISSTMAVFHSIVFIFIPLVMISVFYSCILWTLRKQQLKHAKTILSDYQQKLRQRQRRRINLLAFSIVLAFGICYTPLHFFIYISLCFTKWTAPSGLLKKVIFPAYSLAYANATITPMICILFNTKFRKASKEMLFCHPYAKKVFTSSYKLTIFCSVRRSYELKPLDITHIPAPGNILPETKESVRINSFERHASSHNNDSFVISIE